ncbi:hypothetical protein [Micromonospora sp. IBHARD004]|uniref:hypothetical protein n=1 Tax=Micromonospora sp. IBHARD004 TaxID=3457764 RepID=UPI004058ED18
MRRVVLDCCGVDPLVDLPGAFDVVRQAVETGKLELLATHVLQEEIAATGDADKRARLQAVADLATKVPTGAFILGTSELDQARLSDDTESIDVLRVGRTDGKYTNDALIAATSMYEGCALVTAEERGLRFRALKLGIEVLRPRELLAELGYRAPEPA